MEASLIELTQEIVDIYFCNIKCALQYLHRSSFPNSKWRIVSKSLFVTIVTVTIYLTQLADSVTSRYQLEHSQHIHNAAQGAPQNVGPI